MGEFGLVDSPAATAAPSTTLNKELKEEKEIIEETSHTQKKTAEIQTVKDSKTEAKTVGKSAATKPAKAMDTKGMTLEEKKKARAARFNLTALSQNDGEN